MNDLANKLAEIGKSLVEIATSIANAETPATPIENNDTVKKGSVKKTLSKKTKPVKKVTAPKKKPVAKKQTKTKVKEKKEVVVRHPQKVRNGKNKWVDDGTLFAEEKGKTPRPKNRESRPHRPNLKKEITCEVCGKKEKVAQNLIHSEEIRCNDCIIKGKHLIKS